MYEEVVAALKNVIASGQSDPNFNLLVAVPELVSQGAIWTRYRRIFEASLGALVCLILIVCCFPFTL